MAVIVILGAAGIWYYQSSKPAQNPVVTLPKSTTPSLANQPQTTQPSVTPNQMAGNTSSNSTSSSAHYKDGQYSATGNYNSPGGAQAIDVTATIKDDKITDLTVTPKPSDPKSERYQTQFSQSISGVIVGKSLNDNLDPGNVNGSSLTHAGFVQAIDQIKQQASQ